jgi:DNA-directed RNA polymerase specialized sigma24 family protein
MQRPPWEPMYLECSMEDADESNSEEALLYRRHASTIFAYLRLHAPPREDAEDLLEEVFLAALERDNPMKFFQGAKSAEEEQRAWLRSVARNKLVDFYRRSNRHPALA